MSTWIVIILLILLGLTLIFTILYFIQEQFIFHGERLPADYKFNFERDFKEINIQSYDGETLNGVLFHKQDAKGILVYYHNHSGNIQIKGEKAAFFTNYDYEVLLMDYRGFGKTTGKINESLMLSDAQQWYNLIADKYDKIVIYGRGIGATFAACVASQNKVDHLILEAPVYSLPETGRYMYQYLPYNYILKYKFDTADCFRYISCKITIFHGVKDQVVNYRSSVKLRDLNPDNATLILIDDADHFNVFNHPEYLDALSRIL